jgi:quercetin dioxygenase-like cupin family protein
MADVFPETIKSMPEADIPVPGLQAYLSQGPSQQVIFMVFHEDAEISPHTHAAQWSVVLEGRIDLDIEGVQRTYGKGDRIFVPAGARHAAKIHAGYADVTVFDQTDRYRTK